MQWVNWILCLPSFFLSCMKIRGKMENFLLLLLWHKRIKEAEDEDEGIITSNNMTKHVELSFNFFTAVIFSFMCFWNNEHQFKNTNRYYSCLLLLSRWLSFYFLCFGDEYVFPMHIVLFLTFFPFKTKMKRKW